MIGKVVEFPIERGIFEYGIVVSFDESTGRIRVKDYEGVEWTGYEYQVSLVQVEQPVKG